jgi:hypothetical protein
MKTIKTCIFLIILGFSTFWTLTVAYAQNIKPPFENNAVVDRMRYYREFIESRDGEFIIDTCIKYVAEPHQQWQSDIACGISCYFAVWEDYRGDSTLNIYGSRISFGGMVLDPAGINICSAVNEQFNPKVAFDGVNFMVVWTDYRNAVACDIYGARVSEAGELLDTAGFAICNEAAGQGMACCAFDGTNYLVAWADGRNPLGQDIYAARVTTGGIVIDTNGFIVCDATGAQYAPSIASGDSNYLIVWQDERYDTADIYGARVLTDGTVLDTNSIAICSGMNYQFEPAVAYGGAEYLVAWQDMRNPGGYDVYGTRVTLSGIVLDPASLRISVMPYSQWAVDLVFDGSKFLAVWADERFSSDSTDIYCTRINQNGIVSDSTGIMVSNRMMRQNYPAVESNGTDFCVLWFDFWGENGHYFDDIWGARVDSMGVLLDTLGFIVSTAANYQRNPALCFDGQNYYCVWEDSRESPDTANIYGIPISGTGTVIDSTSFEVSTKAKNQYCPSLAYDGTNFFVVWDNLDTMWSVYGARLNQFGVLIDTDGIYIAPNPGPNIHPAPAVAFGDQNYLVVWSSGCHIYGTRITTQGVIVDTTPISISVDNGDAYNPAIIYDGTNFFVVWESYGYNYSWNIWGVRVSTNGIILDPSGIRISSHPANELRPAVVFDGTQNYFVTWEDQRNGDWDIYGARITTGGLVLDTIAIAVSVEIQEQIEPAVSFDGSDYLVVWQDLRSSTSWDIYGAKISHSGLLINTYNVCSNSGDQISPSLAKGNGDSILIVYSGWADSINQQSAIAMRIWGKFYPFVGIEENAPLKNRMTALSLKIYPSIARKKCNIEYGLLQNSEVSIMMYDATGRLVKKILKESQNAGSYLKIFDTTDLPQGVYFIKLNNRSNTVIKKVILVK